MAENSRKERPILFSGEMVRAILEGRKTQTRRIVKPQLPENYIPIGSGYVGADCYWTTFDDPSSDDADLITVHCPYGKVGDRLWVREAISKPFPLDVKSQNFTGFYRATEPERKVQWTPSIHMPRWASRIALEVTGVRVERLQDITEEDAKAEVASERPAHGKIVGNLGRAGHWQFRQGFRELWDEINGKRASWGSNPWVWVVEFKKEMPR